VSGGDSLILSICVSAKCFHSQIISEDEVILLEKAITLDQLLPGQKAMIVTVTGPAQRRLMDLGFVPGCSVEAVQESPWGDPVAYLVCGAVIALRRRDARYILVQ